MKAIIVSVIAVVLVWINEYLNHRTIKNNQIKLNKIANILASNENSEVKIELLTLLFKIDFADVDVEGELNE